MKYDKIMPHLLDVEEAILGAMLLQSDACKKILHLAIPEIFYREHHQLIAKAIQELDKKNVGIDILTVSDQLRKEGELSKVGGAFVIAQLTNRVASAAHIEHHIRILWQMYIYREIIRISEYASNKSYQQSDDPFELLEDILNKFENLDVQKKEVIVQKLSSQIEAALAKISEENKVVYYSGFTEFDKKLNFGPNNITLFGAGSGIGKTRFLTAFMKGLLQNNKDISILWCNMEDDTPKMIRLFASSFVKLSNDELLELNYTQSVKDKININEAKEMINSWDIEFIDRRMSTRELKGIFKYFCEQRKGRFCILLIDNIMKLKDHDQKLNQTTIDDQICNSIGDIADTCKRVTPSSIVWVHHFTGEQQSKMNLKDAYRPRESHLKGSTRYADTSTQIILCNRPAKFPDLINSYKVIKEAMEHLFITDITKNRNSKTGEVRWFTDIGKNQFKEL